jgi:hypothetical protein
VQRRDERARARADFVVGIAEEGESSPLPVSGR